MANCLSGRDQKIHLIFQNCAPRGNKVSYSNGFKTKGVFTEIDLLPIVITNSFKIQNQTFEKHFHFFWLYDHEIYSFLKSAKFVMTRGIQDKFIHFMQMLTSKQCLHFSKSAFTNANIHKQKTKRLPLVDPLS